MLLDNVNVVVTMIIGSLGLAIAFMFFWSWREKSKRDFEIQMKQISIDEKRIEEEREEKERDRYEKHNQQKKEEDKEIGKIAGGGKGGYIILDLPDDKRPFFHDLLKGFEDYARLKGYSVAFSVDATFSDRIAFKFTLKEGAVNVGTEKIRQDFKEYVNKIRSGDSLDDLPVIISLEEHDLLVTALKNRINFLQHSYVLTKNTAYYYERLFDKMGSMPLLPTQNILVQTGGSMDSRQYKAINSSRLIQGDNNEYHDASDSSITIGNSFNERKSQIEGLSKLIEAIRPLSEVEVEDKENAIRDLEKVKDELQDESEPSRPRIKKWLERAKTLVDFAKFGKDIVDIAKQVYESFGMSVVGK